jgi:DNA-binding CsgD family transcriptional regulator
MQKYTDLFRTIFTIKLLAFGYEQISKNGSFISLCNIPRLPELFVETNAFEQMDFLSTSIQRHHGFVHQNTAATNKPYLDFRNKISQELSITTTFYVVEECLDYYQTFIWNFASPIEYTSEESIQNGILLDYLNNISIVKYCLKKFKEEYYKTVKNNIPFLNISLEQKQQLFIETNEVPTNRETLQSLVPEFTNIKKLNLTPKEAWCLHFYSQGMSAKEIASQMSTSRRTIEGYIDKIRRSFNVYSRSGICKKMEILELWKNLL